MNYITQLQHDKRNLQHDLERIQEMLKELRLYLSLPKFRHGDSLDGYVSIADVLNRLHAD